MHTENKIRNAFDSIAAGQELKSSTLDFLQEARRTGQQAFQIQPPRDDLAIPFPVPP